jgi:hypothetical protein
MIVVSPTDRWIRKALGECRTSFRVASPFVGNYLRDRIEELAPKVQVTLLTRTLLSDFASRASDLEAVCGIAAKARQVLSLNSLHAKVYIVDERQALVTSANATFSGMYRNAECGIALGARSQIRGIGEEFSKAFGATHVPKPWALEELQSLREPVALLREALPSMPRVPSAADQPQRISLRPSVFRKLVGEFTGWLQLTLEGVSAIEKPIFSLEEVWTASAPLAAQRFPNNRFPRPKIRQQLQRLRDLGILQFLGGGRYELLTGPSA